VGVDKGIWLGPIRMSDFDTISLTTPHLLLFYFLFCF
jgi:hypothetical protein